MFPVCCHNFIFSQVCGKDFLIYIERTHPHKMQLQIHFTDSASQLTYLQKYHKQLFILSLKSHFLKCKHFSTDPPPSHVMGQLPGQILFNHYRYYTFNHHVFSLEVLLFKGLQFGIIQKAKFQCFLCSERKQSSIYQNTSNVKK